jgi:polar amino acid transport system ATP-binding protein
VPTRPMIEIEGLHKHFGRLHVLRGIDLSVAVGEVVCIIGPSGSGKSTLLRCINHLEVAEQGRIRIDGELVYRDEVEGRFRAHSNRTIAAVRAQVGMVFQHFNLFPHMTALGNVMAGPRIVKRIARSEAEDTARGLLEKVGLGDKADAYPSHLSGGQRQRVAIARALAMNPAVMLCDEVTSALDPELVGEVLGVIEQLAREGMTMVIVTHEVAFAHEVADLVAFMSDGVIVESGPPAQLLENPQNPRTRGFLARFHRFMGGFSGPG